MKVGIITIQDNSNYGNRLQNYAVSEILKNYGMETVTVIVKNKEDFLSVDNKKKWIKRILPIRLIVVISKYKNKKKFQDLKRENKFKKFNQKYINSKTYFINQYSELLKIKKLQEYDYFFSGSDQIWNPYYAGDEIYFLTFVPRKKRIAFIASIGVSELPEEKKDKYQLYLSQMKYISVREEKAVHLIEELVNRKVDCFLDPVFLLEKESWIKIIENIPFEIPSRFLLSFFLGEEPNAKIEKYANENNLSIIYMNNKKYRKYYSLNPAQLLYLIKNAEIILTDSFHVTAFSIIFKKQFYVFKRKQEGVISMFSRMETLLSRFHLLDRIQDKVTIESKKDISKADFENIEEEIKKERKRLEKTIYRICDLEEM